MADGGGTSSLSPSPHAILGKSAEHGPMRTRTTNAQLSPVELRRLRLGPLSVGAAMLVLWPLHLPVNGDKVSRFYALMAAEPRRFVATPLGDYGFRLLSPILVHASGLPVGLGFALL